MIHERVSQLCEETQPRFYTSPDADLYGITTNVIATIQHLQFDVDDKETFEQQPPL